MAKQLITIGTPGAGGGDPAHLAFKKINDNATELYNAAIPDTEEKKTQARANLGLGAAAVEDVMPVSKGGTGATDVETARSNFGLGSAAIKDTGTSDSAIPVLNTENTWSARQIFKNGATSSSYSSEYTLLPWETVGQYWQQYRTDVQVRGSLNYVAVMMHNGNWVNINNSYGGLSDRRLKENIEDATSQIDDIKALRFVNFNMINDTRKQIGLIAQEVQEICPYLVDDPTPATDPNTEQDSEPMVEEHYLSVKYSILSLKVAKAVQELILKVEALEARLNDTE